MLLVVHSFPHRRLKKIGVMRPSQGLPLRKRNNVFIWLFVYGLFAWSWLMLPLNLILLSFLSDLYWYFFFLGVIFYLYDYCVRVPEHSLWSTAAGSGFPFQFVSDVVHLNESNVFEMWTAEINDIYLSIYLMQIARLGD